MRKIEKDDLEVEHTSIGLRVSEFGVSLHFNLEDLKFLRDEIDIRIEEEDDNEQTYNPQ